MAPGPNGYKMGKPVVARRPAKFCADVSFLEGFAAIVLFGAICIVAGIAVALHLMARQGVGGHNIASDSLINANPAPVEVATAAQFQQFPPQVAYESGTKNHD